MPGEMLRLQAARVAVLRRTLSIGLADAWEAARENEDAAFYLLENNFSQRCICRLLLCSWFVTGLNCGSV